MEILGIEVNPATPDEIKKQRESAGKPKPKGNRQAYAVPPGVPRNLNHWREEQRRLKELGQNNPKFRITGTPTPPEPKSLMSEIASPEFQAELKRIERAE